MSHCESDENIWAFVKLKDQIAHTIEVLPNISYFFLNVSHQIPNFENQELGFIRTVSWLYAHYFEAGSVGINYLNNYIRKSESLDLNCSEDIIIHAETVRVLRTQLQHNLMFDSESDAKTSQDCSEWYKQKCGTRQPHLDQHWSACNIAITSQAKLFLNLNLEAIRQIEADKDMQIIVLEGWQRRLERNHPAHEFDRVIEAAATDFGMNSLRITSFRQRHLSTWRDKLELLKDGYDFESEARFIIESSLLDEFGKVLPINAKNVMERFNIKPGPDVGIVLRAARAIYGSDPKLDSQQLLDAIAADEALISRIGT